MITSGAMTNRLNRLEQRGFVKRVGSPTDGRQVLVTLTPAGLTKVDTALVDHAANEADIISSLTQRQQEQLVNLLRILHTAVVRRDDNSNG